MASIPLLRQPAPARPLCWLAVDFGERLACVTLLIALSPLMLLCAAWVALLSGSSPWIAHRRVGWRGSALWMLKLRTMWDDETPRAKGLIEYIDDQSGPDEKGDTDPRIASSFARFCRRHSIDELPQLVHVIRGEMSLIGPRPLTAAELLRHYGPDADEMLEAKPGIAGLWQVSGRNRLTYAERRDLDLEFVRRRSLRLYLRILARTVPEVWNGANTW